MPRFNISRPTAAEIQAHPREFGLYSQLTGSSEGANEDTGLATFVRAYGSDGVQLDSGEVTFDQLAKALRKQPTAVPPEAGSGNALGWAARDESGHLAPYVFTRRSVGPADIRIQIAFCGICHSDLHQVKNEWKGSKYPMVPGHEIVGIVTQVGNEVTGFKVGQRVGVGCMVNSCQNCEACRDHDEQYCAGCVLTYNSKDQDGTTAQGGYSSHVVVNHKFVLHVPENLPLDAAAPLLCAGITTYSPLKHYGLDKAGMKLGVVGLGGLGHMAVKLAKAMGMEVTVISTSPNKEKEAREGLGADHFIVSKDDDAMTKAIKTLDGIIDTVSAQHPVTPLLALLKRNGKIVMVGAPPEPLEFNSFSLLAGRLTIGGSMIGGIKETQEMLDFCGKHNITCDIEKIDMDYVNTAMERLIKNDVHYRFVIDVQKSLVASN
ncbi:hypothetical protein WJX72_001551 [[Myrmecia] bisecta]|uniref:Enoyl reductase (ER) domain-containing protein n=1 Tax=[Myrmecia] bisecta TaxID=41462 RepID=A0AAW1Q4S5_9CHLO